MNQYYKLNNGEKIEVSEVTLTVQNEGYFVLYFPSGSSLKQKGKIEIVEEVEE